MRMSVIVRLQHEAVHCWPSCNIREVMFLKNPHRHIFHIEAEKEVSHSGRDVEFIQLKRQLSRYTIIKWGNNVKDKSCEDLAVELLKTFDLTSCAVFEDGENGAKVYK